MRDARCEIAELWRQRDGRQRVWFVVLFPPLIPLDCVMERRGVFNEDNEDVESADEG